jgi:single-strand DNA-binding protein
MNVVTVMGRLARDPETKLTKTGKELTSFTLCASVGKDKSIFWKVCCWDGPAKKMCLYIKKGSAISVTGSMSEPSAYISRDGEAKASLSMNAMTISFCPTMAAPKEETAERNTTDTSYYEQEEIPF